MIFTKQLLPEVYSESYDMSIFTGLLDLIYNANDFDCLALKALHSPSFCFDEYLSHLASCFNLRTQNRDLLSKYRHLIKIKGTEKAIRAAILLSGATDVTEVPELLVSDESTPRVQVAVYYAQLPETYDEDLCQELLRRVAPVNITVLVLPLELMYSSMI